MTVPELGRLERVTARTVWVTEAQGFTPWLASAENIAILGDVIGLDLEVEGQEQGVGPFRADILCKDTITGHYVLIENQLERTDHGHLGQPITYAAGLDAVTIVWISDRFVEEHRAALDWLNRITNETINFFGFEIELWRIGDSRIAPKFNVVSKPNNWQKTVATAAAAAGANPLSDMEQLHMNFWTQFRQFMEDRQSPIRVNRPSKDNWTSVAVGRTNFVIELWNGMRDNRSGLQLVISGLQAKPLLLALKGEFEGEIEARLGPLEWREMPNRKQSQVRIVRAGKPSEPATWPELNLWMAEHVEQWVAVFRPIVRSIESSAAVEAGAEFATEGDRDAMEDRVD